MKNNKTSKSCSSMQSQEEHSSIMFQFSADITKLKPSNDGKFVTMSVCPTSRALLVANNQVTSASTKDADAFVKSFVEALKPNWMCNDLEEPREDLCPELYREINLRAILAYGNKTKIAKVTGLKAANHDDLRALELKLTTEDFNGAGLTANDALKWTVKDLAGKKGVTITWYMMPIIITNPAPPGPPTLYALLENDENLSTLEAALKAADLDDNLDDKNKHYTLFAPNNAAFAQLAHGTVANLLLLKNKDKLVKLLNNHVVAGNIDAAKLRILAHSADPYIVTLAGKRLQVRMRGQHLYVGKAKVVDADNKASNGLVHKIDAVLA